MSKHLMSKYLSCGSLLILLLVPWCVRADAKADLWAAARKGDAKAVEALLDQGVDINAATLYRATAMLLVRTQHHLYGMGWQEQAKTERRP